MIECVFRPLVEWDTTKNLNRKSPFAVRWDTSLKDLERELKHLRARDIVIQIAVTGDEIRNDGWPRSSASPRHAGVAINFESKHGPLRYVCGTYRFWQDNVRAISLTLTALRAVDRYGAAASGEQYRGYAALPPPVTVADGLPFRNADQAAAWIAMQAGMQDEADDVRFDPDLHNAAYRAAAKKLHPDHKITGSVELFKTLQAAKELVGP